MNNKLTQFKCLVTTFLLVAAMVMPSTAQVQTITPVQPGGEGTASIPYFISTAEELYWFAGLVNGDASVCINGISQNRNAWAVLESDITVNSGVLKADGMLADNVSSFAQWTPIGNSSNRYTGNFDGRGHTISGLYFNNSDSEGGYVGLFGYIDKSFDADASCTIQNVGIVDSYFKGYSCVGSVCGCSYFGTISNCYNTGTVIATDYHSGGICGLSNYSSIEKCYNTGSVEGYTIVGGVAGQCMNGSITNCYNTGSVKGVGTASAGVGGVCDTAVDSEVTNCYNIGTLSGKTVGNVINSSCTTLTNSYYLADGETDEREGTTAMSADQFANGEVAYLLNGNVASSENVWRQNIGGETSDTYPVLNNTHGVVYAGYQHEGTTPLCSNSSSYAEENNLHAHAYDANATTEAGGNHDKSYGSPVYTWEDNSPNETPSVTADFTCTICGHKKTGVSATVTEDDTKTNVAPKCEEIGNNYYKATFICNTNANYCDYYTQTLPALGHDNKGATQINSSKKIYEKYCGRDGCDRFLGYYADAAGQFLATEDNENGSFTTSTYTLQDATPYDNGAVCMAKEFTYTRTLPHEGENGQMPWAAWYVPFELELTDDICAKYDFSRINNVHQYDDNDDGTVDRTVIESFRQRSGKTLHANSPYLVRAKSMDYKDMKLELKDIVPALSDENSIDCQSVDYTYTFKGTYSELANSNTLSNNPYALWEDGEWYHFASLSPMRHYLTIESRTTNQASGASLKCIKLCVIGEEDVTGVVNIYSDERKATETYDLGGRRLPEGSQQSGLLIKNGKVIFNKQK
mgnify:FL=1